MTPAAGLHQYAESGLRAQLDAVAVGVIDIEGLLTVIPGLDLGRNHPFADEVLVGGVDVVHLKSRVVGGG